MSGTTTLFNSLFSNEAQNTILSAVRPESDICAQLTEYRRHPDSGTETTVVHAGLIRAVMAQRVLELVAFYLNGLKLTHDR